MSVTVTTRKSFGQEAADTARYDTAAAFIADQRGNLVVFDEAMPETWVAVEDPAMFAELTAWTTAHAVAVHASGEWLAAARS